MHQLLQQLPVCPEEGVEASAPYTHESATQSFLGTIFVKEQTRRMRGGSQSHLMRCEGDDYYVVKFQGNPQGTRILVNEMLGTLLATRMGLPTTPVAICFVSEDLIRLTPDLCFQIVGGLIRCQPGLHFGSRYLGNPRKRWVLDARLPDDELARVKNVADFAGMLVFDKWTCNTDGRQTLFIRTEHGHEAAMIDQGMCFNGKEWNFPDAPLRGLYAQCAVYKLVSGLDFEPWVGKLKQITESVLIDIGKAIPPEWYGGDWDSLQRLLERLYLRRSQVRELLWETWKTRPYAFPNWSSPSIAASSVLLSQSKKGTEKNEDRSLMQ